MNNPSYTRFDNSSMSPELIAAAIAAVILPGQHAMRRDVADLRERMGQLEGLFDGFTRHDTIRIGRGMVPHANGRLRRPTPLLLSPTGGTSRDQSVTASGRIEIGTMLANRP